MSSPPFSPPRAAPRKPIRRLLGRIARLVVALLVLGSLALAVAQRAGTVGPWWLELSRYLPYPVLLAPGGVALVLSLALGWRWVAASVGALATTAVVSMGLAWGRPDAGELPFRFMTYNIKAYKAVQRPGGIAALEREVARQAPDVLVVQDHHGAGVQRADAVAWPDGRPFGFPYSYRADQYIVASRLPLRDCRLEAFDPARSGSTAAVCTVEVHGIPTTIATVHFDSPRDGLNATRRDGLDGAEDWEQNHVDRLWQARLLTARLQDARRPLILAGDLNAPESSRVVATLLDGLHLRDAYSSAMRGYGYSYGQALRTGFSFLRIDHILVGPEIGVARVRVGDGDASEHRPVIADLWLRRR